MRIFIRSTLTLMKIGVLATAVLVATLGLTRQPSAESASNTEIIFSYSNSAPIPAQAIILTPDGFQRDIYIWATGVKESTGVSGFNIAIAYDEHIFLVSAASADIDGIGDKTWLESSNRGGACIPDLFPEPGQIIGLCSTLQPPPPLGPTGDGLIGHLVLTPGSESASSPVTFVPFAVGVQGTFLPDTPLDPDDIQPIPLTLKSATVNFMGCADNSPPPNGDGVVDLPNDILGVILRFGMLSTDPDWSTLFDLNDDGVIDLPNDILGTILQFQLPCTQP